MTFAQPAGLWLLGLIPILVLIHLLRSNPRRQVVPSAFLWRGLDREVTAARRWRPPRPSLLLLLQLLAVTAVALGIASPGLMAPPRVHVMVLLDASASMMATDVSPSRFGEAVRQARELLADLGPQDHATIIRVGPSPRVLAANVDPRAAQASLTDLQAGAGPAAMREALFVASSLANDAQDSVPEAVVLTDGAFGDPGDLAGLGIPVRFLTIGRSSENVAVTDLNVMRQPRSAGGLEAFARLVNYANRPVRLPVRLLVDGIVQENREVDIPPRSRAELSFAVPTGARRVAVILAGQDPLAADDQAEVAVEAEHARKAILVSRLPEVLERALKAIPDLTVETVSPESYTGGGAELVVLDAVLPERLPRGQLLIVNPPSGRDYLPVMGDLRSVQVSELDTRHPLLQAVDLSAARLNRVTALQPPPWARVVAEAGGSPLVLEGQESGRAVVIFAFDPSGSGIDKMIALPLLVSNAVAFLGGGELSPSLAPGRGSSVPVGPGVRETRLEGPDGRVVNLPATGGSVRLEQVEAPGRYTLRDSSGETRVFSVNVVSEAESNVTPRRWPSVEVAGRDGQPSVFAFELWPALLALGLVVLGAEWWRFGRRS